jgi:hypothetical protein
MDQQKEHESSLKKDMSKLQGTGTNLLWSTDKNRSTEIRHRLKINCMSNETKINGLKTAWPHSQNV